MSIMNRRLFLGSAAALAGTAGSARSTGSGEQPRIDEDRPGRTSHTRFAVIS